MKPSLPLPCLALVTDRTACTHLPLEEAVARAVAGGVQMVQVREKDLPGRRLLSLALRLEEAVRGRALLLVNERADVALACGADGVQLGEEALPVSVVRRLLGPDRLIGRSVHSVEGAVQAQEEGADFLLVGTIFPSATHPGSPPAGAGLITSVKRAVRLPVLAIGGVTAENVREVVRAGADGAAVVRSVLGAEDPAEASARLSRALKETWEEIHARCPSP